MSETNEKKFPRMTEKDRKRFSDPVEAAKWLLGKVICRKLPDGEIMRLYITETEAYYYEDEACYGHGGKITKDNKPLFGKCGTGCAFGTMFLIVCGAEGRSDNVLIRSAGNEQVYFNGPYKIYDGLQLKNFRSVDLLTSDDLWLETDGKERQFCTTERKNLSKNTKPEFKNLKHRFIIL